jgi:DNA-binding transcriptional LysR family regulator
MDIQVFVEPVNGNGYRASALSLSAEAATAEEAVAQLQLLFAQRLTAGAKVVTIPGPLAPQWAKYAGIWKEDDPVIQEYLAILAENRARSNEEENPR